MPGTRIQHEHHVILVSATILARLTIWIFAAYAVGQGLNIIISGDDRWGGASYAVAKQVPGVTLTWGSALAVFGVVTLIGSLTRRWWLKTVGLGGIVAWSLFFAISVTLAAIHDPHAGNTGGPVYFKDALIAAGLIFVSERRLPVRSGA